MITYDYSGRCVLVTGGTRGIGAGIAGAFLAAGAEVIVCGRAEPRHPPDDAGGGADASASASAGAGGRRASFVAADVRDAAQVEGLIETVVRRHGRLDVVVNNAGGSPNAAAMPAPMPLVPPVTSTQRPL